MNPPQLLLEASFIAAVADAEHPQHVECAAAYRRLLDDYEQERLLLVALDEHLRPFTTFRRQGLFAPVDPLHVGHQHRRAARRVRGDVDPELALTLVICHRHKVRRIATLRDDAADFHLEILDLTDEASGPETSGPATSETTPDDRPADAAHAPDA
jgi:hypothetical protein